eukprot:403360599
MKQDLWVAQQQKNEQQQLSKSYKDSKNTNNTRSQVSLQSDLRGSQKKKEKIKSSTLKKAGKKVFNEDLVEIGDTQLQNDDEDLNQDPTSSRLMSDQREYIQNSDRRSRLNQNQSHELGNSSHKKYQSQVYESVKTQSLKRPLAHNPNQINKLEALKFKMSLQARNLKLIKEHDVFIRDIEKKQMGGKRENKLQTMHTVTRLYKDLERTQKQLRQELVNAQRFNGEQIAQELQQECDDLFREAEEYFQQYQKEIDERKVKKDYSKVGSRINSNIKAIKHNKLIVGSQDQQTFQEMEVQSEEVQYQNYNQNQYDEVGDQGNYSARQNYLIGGHSKSINVMKNNRILSLQQQQQQQQYVGDVGSSNYNNHGNNIEARNLQKGKSYGAIGSQGIKLPDIMQRNSVKNTRRQIGQQY